MWCDIPLIVAKIERTKVRRHLPKIHLFLYLQNLIILCDSKYTRSVVRFFWSIMLGYNIHLARISAVQLPAASGSRKHTSFIYVTTIIPFSQLSSLLGLFVLVITRLLGKYLIGRRCRAAAGRRRRVARRAPRARFISYHSITQRDYKIILTFICRLMYLTLLLFN